MRNVLVAALVAGIAWAVPAPAQVRFPGAPAKAPPAPAQPAPAQAASDAKATGQARAAEAKAAGAEKAAAARAGGKEKAVAKVRGAKGKAKVKARRGCLSCVSPFRTGLRLGTVEVAPGGSTGHLVASCEPSTLGSCTSADDPEIRTVRGGMPAARTEPS